MATRKPGRNDKCDCGSGKKYKHCCARTAEQGGLTWSLMIVGLVGVLIAVVYFTIAAVRHDQSKTPAPGRVWSAEHGHYH